MTDPLDAYGDALRRALHAEADAVVPAPDGLERIRTRINERNRRFGWAWFTETWGRPAIALAAAVFIAAVAISATPAINAIEGITAGDRGSAAAGGPDHEVTNGASVPGRNGNPAQALPGESGSSVPRSKPSPQQSPAVGKPTCAASGYQPAATSTPTPPGVRAQPPCTVPPQAPANTPPEQTTPTTSTTTPDGGTLPSSSEPPPVQQQEYSGQGGESSQSGQ